MPPPRTYSKEDVINAAFQIVTKYGIEILSARTLADYLKSSTAPVYSNFSSMDELNLAVIKKAKSHLMKYTSQNYNSSHNLNLAIGICKFSSENKHLFKLLFLDEKRAKELYTEFVIMVEKTDKTNTNSDFISQFWIHIIGLSSLLSIGFFPKDDEFIANKIKLILNQ
jgi:AcrR family transcriptional regulator